jgi:L-rhamnose mutarotase
MTKPEIQSLLRQIQFRNWTFHLGEKNGVLYLQIQFDAPCNHTGTLERQYCRKWQLSEHMTRSEIVGTAWLAIEQAVRHEAAEQFKYLGVSVFDFHTNVDRLAALRSLPNSLDTRP